jgi:hypothetical protein
MTRAPGGASGQVVVFPLYGTREPILLDVLEGLCIGSLHRCHHPFVNTA